MFRNSSVLDPPVKYDVNSDTTWSKLYPELWSLARHLVNSFSVPSWKGQQDDIIGDIVQETTRRLIERSRKAERGEATPIHSPQYMMTVIARNYCQDLRRHDRRLFHFHTYDYTPQVHVGMDEQLHPLELVTEKVHQELLLKLIAKEVSNFPAKQRRALLIDLANRMSFDGHPTSLQQAFLEVGIQLQQYQLPLPSNPQERSRHISLLNHAYKRIAGLRSLQQYID